MLCLIVYHTAMTSTYAKEVTEQVVIADSNIHNVYKCVWSTNMTIQIPTPAIHTPTIPHWQAQHE